MGIRSLLLILRSEPCFSAGQAVYCSFISSHFMLKFFCPFVNVLFSFSVYSLIYYMLTSFSCEVGNPFNSFSPSHNPSIGGGGGTSGAFQWPAPVPYAPLSNTSPQFPYPLSFPNPSPLRPDHAPFFLPLPLCFPGPSLSSFPDYFVLSSKQG